MQASFGLIQEKNTGNLNHSAKDWRKSSSSRDWETARPVDLIWNEALWDLNLIILYGLLIPITIAKKYNRNL